MSELTELKSKSYGFLPHPCYRTVCFLPLFSLLTGYLFPISSFLHYSCVVQIPSPHLSAITFLDNKQLEAIHSCNVIYVLCSSSERLPFVSFFFNLGYILHLSVFHDNNGKEEGRVVSI